LLYKTWKERKKATQGTNFFGDFHSKLELKKSEIFINYRDHVYALDDLKRGEEKKRERKVIEGKDDTYI